jgi:hypothetical protein
VPSCDRSEQLRSTAEHLIRLQINQDSSSQAWTKFFITIQTGLGTAFGILLLYGRFTGIKLLLALAVAIAGIGTSFVIRKIVSAITSGQPSLSANITTCPVTSRNAFSQCGMEKPTQRLLMRFDPGEIGKLIMRLCEATMVFWIIAAVTALVVWGSAAVPTRI